MPTILIAETNGTMAQRLAQTLTGAGHRPLLAPELRAALKEWRTMPDLLLDRAFAGGELLRQLPALPNAAGVSVLGMTDRTQGVAPKLPPWPSSSGSRCATGTSVGQWIARWRGTGRSTGTPSGCPRIRRGR